MEWAYTIQASRNLEPNKNVHLPSVQLAVEKAQLGAVLTEVALQGGITLVYPPLFDERQYSGTLSGPADVILDFLARSADFRFAYHDGVGYIGKPLADDRSVAVVRMPYADAVAFIAPLLSDGGKVSSAGTYALVADRSDSVAKIITALQQLRPQSYAFQLLEIYADESSDASMLFNPSPINEAATLHLHGPTVTNTLPQVLSAQISFALQNRSIRLGRTWLSVLNEGHPADGFIGTSETRQSSVLQQNAIASSTLVVQIGWHVHIDIRDGIASGTIFQDGGSDQFTIPFGLQSPGLYLVNIQSLSSREVDRGFRWGTTANRWRRYVWVRYQPLGALLLAPPLAGSDTPIQIPPSPQPFDHRRPQDAAPAATRPVPRTDAAGG